MSSILFVFTRSPHSSINAAESLDALLMGSAFAECSVLFTGEGVLQLVTDQDTESLGTRNFTKGFTALADYGVTRIYCSAKDLQAYGLSAAQAVIQVEAVDDEQARSILVEHDTVLNF